MEKDFKADVLSKRLKQITNEINIVYTSLDKFSPQINAVNRAARRKAEKQDIQIQRLRAKLEKLNTEGELIIQNLKGLGVV